MQTSHYLKMASGCLVLALLGSGAGVPVAGATPAAPVAAAVPHATLYVAASGNDSNNCTVNTTPCLTINGALSQSVAGDTINVTNEPLTGTGNEVVLVNKAITIKGGWDPGFLDQFSQTPIDAQNARRALTVDSGVSNVTLENFIIKNGNGGSGVQGGLYAQGSVTIRNTSFLDNATGLVVNGSGIVVVTLNSAFYNNGVGALVNEGTAEFRNVTVSGNTSKGISSSGTVLINNATIVNNGAQGALQGTGFTLQNSILASNTADCVGAYTSGGFNVLSAGASACTTAQVTDKIVTDPGLGVLKSNGGRTPTHLPFPASPAVNAGSNVANPACESVDQRGQSRPFGARCDAGAVEFSSIIHPLYLAIIRR